MSSGEILQELLQDHPYLWVLLIIFGVSAAPILTPPTWMVIVSANALSDYSLNPLLLSSVGATAATSGRMLLLKYSSIGRRRLNEKRKSSLERLRDYLQKTRYGYFASTFIFALTPLPSNMLFISYGLMNARSFLGIVAGFWIGRFAVYLLMIYVSGFVYQPISQILGDNLTAVIITDIAGMGMTVAILMVDWDRAISERKIALIRPRFLQRA
ncbi:DedA family protein [Candidatus Nitrososphaera gargensis Ga9.2]|uniref:DedA family protein n=1 Tax=Nitrososphaera gargensis (strain Ga9.2) TaxID=1237085 RepID=K0IJN2_NITGG|nr:hypothetical protein [Candidatus Nitrososphaera gargensis]AFU60260.1 DedA family protein [Candidatus Nitrososphaera gargensis Ga9.2]